MNQSLFFFHFCAIKITILGRSISIRVYYGLVFLLLSWKVLTLGSEKTCSVLVISPSNNAGFNYSSQKLTLVTEHRRVLLI